jgi:hypothetical protein
MHARLAVGFLSVVLLFPFAAWSEDEHPARLLPETALAYFEISQPDKLIDLATNSSLWELVKRANAVEAYLQSDAYRQFLSAVELMERRLGAKWQPALRDLVGGGVYAAIEPLTQSGLLIVKPRKPELLTKLHEAVIEMAEAEARRKGAKSPVKSEKYNGVVGWSLAPREFHAIVGGMLVISNSEIALKGVVDRFRGESKKSLAGVKEFEQARQEAPADRIAWGMARLAPLQLLKFIPDVNKALNGPSDNFGGEWLVGGILDAVKNAAYASFSLHLDQDRLRLRFALPHDRSKIAAKRKWFFAPDAEKSAFAPLAPKGTIASFTTYRDNSGLWLAREELFNEEIVAQLSQVDSGLGLYFAGRDFGREVLGALTPRMQIVVTRQEYEKGEPIPSFKVPAFALLLQMKNPEDFGKQLLLSYQTAVGFFNVVGGMNGQPKSMLDVEEYQSTRIWRARFLEEGKIDRQAAPIQFNFSPACAQVGDRFILSSTVGLARDLVDELKKPAAVKLTSSNFELAFDVQQLSAILADNKEPLITQNMLQEGHSRAEAATQIDLLLEVLRATRTASIQWKHAGEQFVMEAMIGVPGGKK